ncbi:MAG TPA: arsenic resistance N-acetyltransferase ArsN2 [Noviherbaspirillum sp.]|nr:arsenic resistance N-acetyltransferase ArsN2 [Noviherbaspirillum sp.]
MNTNPMTACSIKPVPPSPALMELLTACKLPVVDISDTGPAQFFGTFANDELVGAVGLEAYGDVALLRSLAVKPAQRGRGLGRMLLLYVEQHAAAHGIRDLYLLTTTAAPFFSANGYIMAERRQAPEAIQATAQFSGLCPSVASFMCKRLPPD